MVLTEGSSISDHITLPVEPDRSISQPHPVTRLHVHIPTCCRMNEAQLITLVLIARGIPAFQSKLQHTPKANEDHPFHIKHNVSSYPDPRDDQQKGQGPVDKVTDCTPICHRLHTNLTQTAHQFDTDCLPICHSGLALAWEPVSEVCTLQRGGGEGRGGDE